MDNNINLEIRALIIAIQVQGVKYKNKNCLSFFKYTYINLCSNEPPHKEYTVYHLYVILLLYYMVGIYVLCR